MEECGPCPVLVSYTLAFALQLRKKPEKLAEEADIGEFVKQTFPVKFPTRVTLIAKISTHIFNLTRDCFYIVARLPFGVSGILHQTWIPEQSRSPYTIYHMFKVPRFHC